MEYTNPIILSDYSDPDVIRHKNNYYMIASSFNHVPGVPVLKSKNLVDWKLINYVFDKIPFERFKDVCHGDGAWAPSLRYNNGKFYAVIPFPDEGIYVSECTDIEKGDWSPLWCLIDKVGIEDPCPIWTNDGKCYLVIGFVKSRIGFNSQLAVYEVSPDLKQNLSGDYKIVFDGHNTQPTIEGPKFHERNGYYYIMAPAGSVKTGWQTCLRSKNIYGPYEEKIVMTQGDTKINGPHQGALIDLPNDKWAFIHFQDMAAYGRIVNLEPARWINDWPIPGLVRDELLAGTPVDKDEYPVDVKSSYKIQNSDDFKGDSVSLMWQTPANRGDNWFRFENGLIMNSIYHNDEALNALNLQPNSLLTKLVAYSFKVRTEIEINNLNDGDDAGLTLMAREYGYISFKKKDGKTYLQISKGSFGNVDEVLYSEEFNDAKAELNIFYKGPNTYYFGVNGKKINIPFTATPGRWIGAKYGLFARGSKNSTGFAKFNYFKLVIKNESKC